MLDKIGKQTLRFLSKHNLSDLKCDRVDEERQNEIPAATDTLTHLS